MGVFFSPEEVLLVFSCVPFLTKVKRVCLNLQIVNMTKETKRLLPSTVLSVTVPHTLSLPDQVKLAEQLEVEGADIIQTEGGKSSTPSKAGVLGLIEKVTTLMF